MSYAVYLSGEIHSNWREEIENGVKSLGLDIVFLSPITEHDASDAAGDRLGPEGRAEEDFWRDHKSAKVNAIRTKTLIQKSDLVVVRFGDKFKQWNAAFDAGLCAAMNKPYITLHDANIVHALKEVDAAAMAWASTTEQVVEILEYVNAT